MVRKFFLTTVVGALSLYSFAQDNTSKKVYTTSGGEFIFGFANAALKSNEDLPVLMRFTLFLHLSHYWNYDLNDRTGFFSGFSLRNIGFITREPYDYKGVSYDNIRTKRRSYALGVPIAVKFGSLGRNFFLYGGGQYEWLFHYKEKHFIGDTKIKTSEWFSNKTNPLVPSVFGGIQFPGGPNVRFTYMLDNFLNPSEFPQFKKSRLFYFSLSFHFKTKKLKNPFLDEDHPKTYASNIL